MVESGRIYSILSEKPTRALDGGRRPGEPDSSLTNSLLRNDG